MVDLLKEKIRKVSSAFKQKVIKKIFYRLLRVKGWTISKSTSPKAIKKLISELKPIKTDLVRIGPDTDGGYLVPDDLSGIEYCFSPGTSDQVGFELDLANRGKKIYLADWSVEKPPASHENFYFTKTFIGNYSDTNFISLEEWIDLQNLPSNSDLLLQMDVEGFEYEILLATPIDVLKKFRVIVVEFHNLGKLFENEFFQFASLAFRKLLKNHSCVHIHPNNFGQQTERYGIQIPHLLEFTFYRKDRIKTNENANSFPHKLDVDNFSKLPCCDLPKSWY